MLFPTWYAGENESATHNSSAVVDLTTTDAPAVVSGLTLDKLSQAILAVAERRFYGVRPGRKAPASEDASPRARWRWEVVSLTRLPKDIQVELLAKRRLRKQYLKLVSHYSRVLDRLAKPFDAAQMARYQADLDSVVSVEKETRAIEAKEAERAAKSTRKVLAEAERLKQKAEKEAARAAKSAAAATGPADGASKVKKAKAPKKTAPSGDTSVPEPPPSTDGGAAVLAEGAGVSASPAAAAESAAHKRVAKVMDKPSAKQQSMMASFFKAPAKKDNLSAVVAGAGVSAASGLGSSSALTAASVPTPATSGTPAAAPSRAMSEADRPLFVDWQPSPHALIAPMLRCPPVGSAIIDECIARGKEAFEFNTAVLINHASTILPLCGCIVVLGTCDAVRAFVSFVDSGCPDAYAVQKYPSLRNRSANPACHMAIEAPPKQVHTTLV